MDPMNYFHLFLNSKSNIEMESRRRGFPGDVREAVQKECDAKMHKYLGPIYRCFTMFYLWKNTVLFHSYVSLLEKYWEYLDLSMVGFMYI